MSDLKVSNQVSKFTSRPDVALFYCEDQSRFLSFSISRKCVFLIIYRSESLLNLLSNAASLFRLMARLPESAAPYGLILFRADEE